MTAAAGRLAPAGLGLQQAQRLQRLEVFGADHLAAHHHRLAADDLPLDGLHGGAGGLARGLGGGLVEKAIGGNEVGDQGGHHCGLGLAG